MDTREEDEKEVKQKRRWKMKKSIPSVRDIIIINSSSSSRSSRAVLNIIG